MHLNNLLFKNKISTLLTVVLSLHFVNFTFAQVEQINHLLIKTVRTGSIKKDALCFGLALLGKPYVAATLEYSPEQLVINLNKVDCTTFVEQCVALSMSSTAQEFSINLKKLRYRNGQIDGYASRIHYLSEWINNLKTFKNYTDFGQNGKLKHTIKVGFMSTYPHYYTALNDKEQLYRIKQMEKEINNKKYTYGYYTLANFDEAKLEDGDIVAFLSNKAGLDFDHLGFVYRDQTNQFKLLHASTDSRKVEITKTTLKVYLQTHKKFKGMVLIK